MSKKPLENFCSKIQQINKNYAAYTSAIRIYEKDGCTYTVMLTDDLVLFILMYDPNAEDAMEHDKFTLKNKDYFEFCYGVTNSIETYCDTICAFMTERYGKYRPILDGEGFNTLVKTRKAILSRDATYSSHGFTRYTREQQNSLENKLMEQADVVMTCINITRDNPIAGSIATILNVIFDSVSIMYRKEFLPYRNYHNYSKFKAVMTEYLDMDVPNIVLQEAFELFKSVAGRDAIGYDYDEPF